MAENLDCQDMQGIKCYAPEMAHDGHDYPLEAFEHLVELEAGNFWFRSRNRILTRVFRKYLRSPGRPKVLEIGCGTGYVLSGLKLENRYELVGAELHTKGLIFAQSRLPDVEFVQLNACNLPYVSEFDAIGAFDVLEHIEEDGQVIRSVYQALVSGGLFIVTVPQHQWLWSPADDHARHKRRYSRNELISKLELQGFAVEYCSSFVFSLLPLMFISRMNKRRRQKDGAESEAEPYGELKLPKAINSLMGAMMAVDELLIAMGLSLPVGGSLLVVARRPST